VTFFIVIFESVSFFGRLAIAPDLGILEKEQKSADWIIVVRSGGYFIGWNKNIEVEFAIVNNNRCHCRRHQSVDSRRTDSVSWRFDRMDVNRACGRMPFPGIRKCGAGILILGDV